MMWYWYVGLAILIVILFVWMITRPQYIKNVTWEEFENYFKGLLEYTDGSWVSIDHQNTLKFVQFMRQKDTLCFAFPDAPWSKEYFEILLDRMKDLNFEYVITDGKGSVIRFLEIDINLSDKEKAVSSAVRIARTTFGIMGLDENSKFKIHYEGNLRCDEIRARLKAAIKEKKDSSLATRRR